MFEGAGAVKRLALVAVMAAASSQSKGPEMTTDNPNPLEVWRLAMEAHNTAFHDERDACPFESATKAAAAIIAQHYAPVIAENERLREALRRYGDRIRMAMAPAELQQTIDDALGAKP